MIKGVNRRIVEVTLPESAYFEKAVIFLRSDSIPAAGTVIREEAKNSIKKLESELPKSEHNFARRAAACIRLAAQIAVIICAAWLVYTSVEMFLL